MPVTLRAGTPDDAEDCREITVAAFKTIADQHNMQGDTIGPAPTPGRASNPKAHVIVAEIDGRIVGSAGMDERCDIVGVGPVTVDPTEQNSGIGRMLMDAVVARIAQTKAPGARLMQDAFHSRSLVLYIKAGFSVREPTVIMQGAALNLQIPGCSVRAGTATDVKGCNLLYESTHGMHRGGEVESAANSERLLVVERDGRITGYSTTVGFFGHSVGETNDDLKALIGGVESFPGAGFHLPAKDTELFQWCLDNGLKMVRAMTLMSIGLYYEPKGPYLPSINY